jgi:hypothetical protein
MLKNLKLAAHAIEEGHRIDGNPDRRTDVQTEPDNICRKYKETAYVLLDDQVLTSYPFGSQ